MITSGPGSSVVWYQEARAEVTTTICCDITDSGSAVQTATADVGNADAANSYGADSVTLREPATSYANFLTRDCGGRTHGHRDRRTSNARCRIDDRHRRGRAPTRG